TGRALAVAAQPGSGVVESSRDAVPEAAALGQSANLFRGQTRARRWLARPSGTRRNARTPEPRRRGKCAFRRSAQAGDRRVAAALTAVGLSRRVSGFSGDSPARS